MRLIVEIGLKAASSIAMDTNSSRNTILKVRGSISVK